MKQPIECVDVIALHHHGIVVVKRLTSPCGLALPGGKVEEGESAEATAMREFFEETGLMLTLHKKMGVYDEPGRDPRGHYVSTVFIGRASGDVKHEAGKTQVHLLSCEELKYKKTEFINDHYQMLTDYFMSL